MSYSVKDTPNLSRIITPEILAIEVGVAALKESGEGLIEVGRVLIEKSVKFEKKLEDLRKKTEARIMSE